MIDDADVRPCDLEALRYPTRRLALGAAVRAIRFRGRRGTVPYRCKLGHWHIGPKPKPRAYRGT